MRLLSAIFGDNGLVHSTGEVFETRLELSYREMQKTAPEFISYFETHVLGKIRDNLAASQLPHLADVSWPWTNNLAKSLNHVLKQTTNWRNLSLPALVEKLHDLVHGQSKEIERSLIGRGDLMLQEQFLRFRMTSDAWQALPDGKKRNTCRVSLKKFEMQICRCQGGGRVIFWKMPQKTKGENQDKSQKMQPRHAHPKRIN